MCFISANYSNEKLLAHEQNNNILTLNYIINVIAYTEGHFCGGSTFTFNTSKSNLSDIACMHSFHL